MAEYKTDEQLRSVFMPKIKAFTDERLTEENAKRIYNHLMPYHYDKGGLLLYQAAEDILQTDVYSEFPAEDNMGYFENLDGYELLKWLEIAKFADKKYEQLSGGYEKLKSHALDTKSPEYKDYQGKLYAATLRSITDRLMDKQPYLLEGFWNRLSYIENILEKGFPTREDLNRKIEREAEKIFAAASENDLISFHSEVEIKYKICDALRETSMTDEMVQALFISDNALDDVYRFFTTESKDNQVHLAVWEYLEKAEHEYLTNRVYDRVALEYEDYKDEIKAWPTQKIIDEAPYKLVLFDDIQTSLDPCSSTKFSTEQLKALMSFTSPLWSIYDEWQDRDDTRMDDLSDAITDAADKQAAEIEEKNGERNFEETLDYEDEDEPEL